VDSALVPSDRLGGGCLSGLSLCVELVVLLVAEREPVALATALSTDGGEGAQAQRLLRQFCVLSQLGRTVLWVL